MDKYLVFGLGTGRCGTFSLSELLNRQPDSEVSHEVNFLPWDYDEKTLLINLNSILNRKSQYVGDVGFYWLNYVEKIISMFPDAKFVCLKRERQPTVDSWYKHSGKANHWSKQIVEDEIVTRTSNHFPKIYKPKKEAIGVFYDIYYWKAEYLQERYPLNFMIFDMAYTLNNQTGMELMLKFAGYYSFIFADLHLNQTGTWLVQHKPMPIQSGICEFCKLPDSASWYIHNYSLAAVTYACTNCKETADLGVFNLNEKEVYQ